MLYTRGYINWNMGKPFIFLLGRRVSLCMNIFKVCENLALVVNFLQSVVSNVMLPSRSLPLYGRLGPFVMASVESFPFASFSAVPGYSCYLLGDEVKGLTH